MNVADLTTTCELRFRDTANAIVSEPLWLEYLNLSHVDVVTADPYWPFLESQTTSLVVSSGAGTVALPTDSLRVSAVYNATRDVALVPIDGRSEYRHWFPNADENLGTPQFYRLRGSTLEVYPFADTATTLHVDYFVHPGALVSGEPVFPEAYHRILVHGALAYAYEDDGQLQQADVHRAQFERLLQRMRMDLLSPRTESFPMIVDNFGSW